MVLGGGAKNVEVQAQGGGEEANRGEGGRWLNPVVQVVPGGGGMQRRCSWQPLQLRRTPTAETGDRVLTEPLGRAVILVVEVQGCRGDWR